MPDPLPSFSHEIAALRPYLMRFARLQLRNESWAEDAVSETLLAALSNPRAFGQQAQLRTWLVGILKHKVMDLLRQHARDARPDTPSAGADPEDPDAALFQEDGHFAQMPAEWGNPESALSSRQFFEILEACTEKLPPALGRVFLMREWLELSVEEICKELGLSTTNLYVQLHRARMRLRECLELNWFARTVTP